PLDLLAPGRSSLRRRRPLARRGRFLLLRHSALLRLLRRRLLAGYGPPRSLARARVGVRSLSTGGQVPSMPEPAVAPEVDQPLDPRGYVPPEIALDLVAGVDHAPQTRELLVVQVVALPTGIDLGLGADLERRTAANPVDVGERDLHPLVVRQVDSR